ncbi:hypothetical protein JCGZ_12793 [Jatropha curcas]|uniref:Uncharacterized protein n=1 Tax=Jatropha curcas TaxID=180498 RepID=A0A067KHE6_JATCU|nr:hypothetical protein JCGZ_12793 [Jatropha curcas]
MTSLYTLSNRSIRLEQDITTAQKGSAATDHLAAFVLGAYTIFVWTQLLVYIPPLIEFDPFTEAEELDRGQGDAPVQLWAFEKLQVMDPPSDHLRFDYRSRVYVQRSRHLTGKTIEDWTAIFQDLTSEGVRWTCPWWYIERVKVSLYMLYVPLCGLTMAVGLS